MPPSNLVTSKLKTTLKLLISRLRHLQTKESSLSKQTRRTIATLLESHPPRLESAKIRVENTIRQDILVELLEILELYSELLLARIHMLEGAGSCDAGLEEAVKSLIYASQRVEVKELGMVRDLLTARFGKEFALAARDNVGGGVSERVLKKLRVETPSEELVQAYLREIARTYGVDFEGAGTPGTLEGGVGEVVGDDDDDDDDDDEPSTGRKIAVGELELADPKVGELVEDAKTPPRKVLPKSPIHVAPASPSSENPHPVVRMLGEGGGAGVQRQHGRAVQPKGVGTALAGGGAAVAQSGGKSKEDKEVDDLLARFAALKKR